MRCSAIALVVALVAIPVVLRAEEPPRVRFASVRTAGAESCPDTTALARDVARRLGRDPFDPTAERIIEVVLSREPRGWGARIFVRSANGITGTRSLSSLSPNCDELASDVALAVALAIDPDGALAPRPSSPVVVPSRVSRTLRAPRATPIDCSHRVVTGGASLRGGLTAGLVPRVAPMFSLSIEQVASGPLRLSIGTLFVPETRTDDEQFGFLLAAGTFAGCFAGNHSRLTWELCAGIQAGGVYAVVYAREPDRPGGYPWVALNSGLRGALHLIEPWFLETGVDVTVPVLRQRFVVASTVGEERLVFQQWPVTPMGFLGLGRRF